MGINHQRKFEGLTSVRIFAYIETDKARLWNMVTFFSSCSIPGGSESTERFLRHWGAGDATHWSKWTEIWVQTWGKILVSFGKRPLDSWVFSNMFRQSNIWTAINWVVGLYGIYSRGELVARQTNPPDRHEVLSAAMLFLSHGVTGISLAKVAEISAKRSSIYTKSDHGMGHNNRQAQRGADGHSGTERHWYVCGLAGGRWHSSQLCARQLQSQRDALCTLRVPGIVSARFWSWSRQMLVRYLNHSKR